MCNTTPATMTNSREETLRNVALSPSVSFKTVMGSPFRVTHPLEDSFGFIKNG